jgi:hypothetical protein
VSRIRHFLIGVAGRLVCPGCKSEVLFDMCCPLCVVLSLWYPFAEVCCYVQVVLKGCSVAVSDRLLWFACGSGVRSPGDDEFSWCAVFVHVADFFEPSCSSEFDHLGDCITVVELFSYFFVCNFFFFYLVYRNVQHSAKASMVADFEFAAIFLF